MSDECLFCKIVKGEIPADVIDHTLTALAFRDINPQASTHVLIIPKKHISTINDLKHDDSILIGEMFLIAKELAQVENINNSGFRMVFNCNEDGGQTVFHIHLHLLGGRKLSWPPG